MRIHNKFKTMLGASASLEELNFTSYTRDVKPQFLLKNL